MFWNPRAAQRPLICEPDSIKRPAEVVEFVAANGSASCGRKRLFFVPADMEMGKEGPGFLLAGRGKSELRPLLPEYLEGRFVV